MVKSRPRNLSGSGTDESSVRASVSFERGDYSELEQIAAEKRVSVASVVREAVARYLHNRAPLFRGIDRTGVES